MNRPLDIRRYGTRLAVVVRRERPAYALGYFVVVVGFFAVAVAGGVAGFDAITGVSAPPASTERQSAGS